MLTGSEIYKMVKDNRIVIDPFDKSRLGANSYDIQLENFLYLTKENRIDSRGDNELYPIEITDEGYVLNPGILYLGSTVESTISLEFIPMLTGRSSIARLGISIHLTAGFGDLGWGFKPFVYGDNTVGSKEAVYKILDKPIDRLFTCSYPTWTLEISVVQPVTIYPDTIIGQVYFAKPEGKIDILYNGKYSEQYHAVGSRLFQEIGIEK